MPSTIAKIVRRSGLVLLTFVLLSLSISAQQFTENITNKVPGHVPLKIEIKNNEFGSDLAKAEIIVTNTSNKSIYYLSFMLITPDDFPKLDGHRLSVSNGFSFGKGRLSNVSLIPEKDDAFIGSNETIMFRIEKPDAEGFLDMLHRNGITDVPRLHLIIQTLSHGDGTGFLTTGGTPYPSKEQLKLSSINSSAPFFFQ